MKNTANEILQDPCASFPLKETLKRFLDRDPVDALNDAEVLVIALKNNLRIIREVR